MPAKTRISAFFVITVSFAALLAPFLLSARNVFAQDAPPAEALPAAGRTVVVIPVSGLVDGGLLDSVERRIQEAKALDPALIVFEIDTYGGLLDFALEITDAIGAVEKPLTVAYVPDKAYSAGALIAMGAREIVMGPLASFGDAAPVAQTPDGIEMLPEKIQSPTRNAFRKYAQRNGYSVALSEAMVSTDIVVYEVVFENGATKYLSADEVDSLPPAEQSRISFKTTVVRDGELLTMNAEEARKYGFARFIVRSFDELLADYSLAGAAVTRIEQNWSEAMVRALNHPAVTGLLVLIGILGLYMEFKVPGFGLPGTVAILCFVTLIFSKYLSGMALYWEVLVFILGVALLAVELFVIPGFGVTGMVGIGLMVAGLILMLLPARISSAPIDVNYVAATGIYFAVAVLLAILLAILLARFLPRTPFLSAIYLGAPEQRATGRPAVSGPAVRNPVGARGVALTPLRPVGKASFDGERVEVTTRGDHIPAGATVEVVERKGGTIIVKAVQ